MAVLPAFSGIPKATGDTSIQKLTTDVRVAPEGIRTTDLELVMPAIGQLNGGGTISSSNELNLKMVATLSAQSGLASAVGGLTGRTMSKMPASRLRFKALRLIQSLCPTWGDSRRRG